MGAEPPGRLRRLRRHHPRRLPVHDADRGRHGAQPRPHVRAPERPRRHARHVRRHLPLVRRLARPPLLLPDHAQLSAQSASRTPSSMFRRLWTLVPVITEVYPPKKKKKKKKIPAFVPPVKKKKKKKKK